MSKVFTVPVTGTGGTGGARPPSIRTEFELREATKLIQERDELSDLLGRVCNQLSIHSSTCSRTAPLQITVATHAGYGSESIMAPRWMIHWIEAGLRDRIDEIKGILTETYGIPQ